MVTFVLLFIYIFKMWSVEFDAIIGYRYCGDNNNKDKSEKILKKGTHVLISPPPNKGNKTICTIYNTIITAVDNETEAEEQFFHQKQNIHVQAIINLIKLKWKCFNLLIMTKWKV